MVRKAALSERKSTLVPRIRFSRPPEGLRKILIIPQMTMVEMKWGAYSTVCTTRLNFAKRSWLMHRDRMMGMGKLHSRLYRLSSTVFLIMRTQLGAVKNRSNQYRPTHSLPVMPRLALKSRKAIWMPYMGQYL